MTTAPVMAITDWGTNGHLIADVVRLGYLRDDWSTLDPTYGLGTFWSVWRPKFLVATDINPARSIGEPTDFTAMPWADSQFDAVVFDPPYKLNGTPTEEVDGRYGADVVASWQARMAFCRAGIRECARVLGDGYLLVKCQDQVCSGKIRWQTIDFAEEAERCGLGLVDRLDFLSYRPQPNGTRQVTARRCSSQMLVFRRDHRWRP